MSAAATVTERSAPSLISACAHRYNVEFRQFWRVREGVFFTALFPVLMLLLFGSIFGTGDVGNQGSGVTFPQYFAAGMIGTGIWLSGFQNLGITVPLERDSGALKRLYGTPMPKAAYFVGKILLTLTLSALQVVVLLVVGRLFYHVQVPAERIPTLLWVSVLGVTSCSLLGMAIGGLVRNGPSSTAVIAPIALVLQFVSGVYFVFSDLPSWMQFAGSLFPLRWLTLGMRSVFLPDSFAASEPGNSWQPGMTALVLAIWCVVGFVITLRTFRWMSERER